MQGRSEEQRRDLARRVTAALDQLLPQVEIISVNVAEFERATYFNKLKLQAEAGLPS